jgi:hypothetical protein
MRIFAVRGCALAAAALFATGCGSGSSASSTNAEPNTFRSDFGLVVGQFKQSAQAIGLVIEHARSMTDAQLAATFSGLAARWQGDLTKLRSLTPPPSVSAQYKTLTGAATRTEGDLRAIVGVARAHDASAAKRASAKLVKDILQAKAASQSITTRLGIG